MHNTANLNAAERKARRIGKLKSYIFPAVMLAYPILQSLIFYFGVNINSVLLAFKEYGTDGGYHWLGFKNFSTVFYDFSHDPQFGAGFRNSAIALLLSLVVTTPLSTLFSFFIYKRYRGGEFFKVMLVMPMITSSLVMVLLFTGFVDKYLPKAMEKWFGIHMKNLVSDTTTQLYVVLFYSVLVGFGTSSLLYLGAMNGIDPSITEAGEMDGITAFKEYFYIVLPSVYSTFSTLVVVAVAGVFANQLNLYSFFGRGAQAETSTIGYYLYKNTQSASLSEYPRLAAMGIILTLIVAPVTLLVKYLIEKFGPTVE